MKCNTVLPSHVHQLNIFFSVALYKHEVLFSVSNQKKIEQWIEAVVRLYLHDRTRAQRRVTMQWLDKNRACVWKNAEALFSFEGIIHTTVTQKMKDQESAVGKAWERFYKDIDRALGRA